jgi:hypothetical protein
MEMQEMMERLLAEIKADRKADQENAHADRTTHQEQMLAEIRADRQADRELLIGIMDVNTKSMREDIKSSQAEIISTIDAWITDIKVARKETTACHDKTEASIKKMEPNPGKKETVLEKQEIPKEEVAVHS